MYVMISFLDSELNPIPDRILFSLFKAGGEGPFHNAHVNRSIFQC